MPPDPASEPAHLSSAGIYRTLGVVGLLINFGLLGWLFHGQAQTRASLSKLQTAMDHRQSTATEPSDNDLHRPVAGRQERVALLLAAAADAAQTHRILEPLPLAECVEVARALLAQSPANDRNAALGAVFQRIAGDDPVQAINLVAAVPEAGLKSDLAAKVAAAWIDRDPAAAAAWLAGDGAPLLAPTPLRLLLASAVARWSAFDPAAATRFVAASPLENSADAQELRVVSRDWGRKDPGAALAWTQSIPPGDPRKAPATYGALEGWTDLAPTQAAGYVGQLAFGTGRSYAGEAAAVAARWTEQQPTAAAQWAAGLPDRLARRDALKQVAATWAKVDAPSAARWAAGLPAGGERGEIWQGIGDFWAETDPAGTESWLSTLPAGGDRDAAVAAYTAKIVAVNPEKALTWAKTLSVEPFATQQIQTLLAAWSRKDAVAARNWAATNQFAPTPLGAGR